MPTEPKHTPTPWHTDPDCPELPSVINGRHHEIARVAGLGWDESTEQANAARIVACVNACEGIDDPAAALAAARRALAAAVRNTDGMCLGDADTGRFTFAGADVRALRAALALLGGAP